jgi:hypothetical protein
MTKEQYLEKAKTFHIGSRQWRKYFHTPFTDKLRNLLGEPQIETTTKYGHNVARQWWTLEQWKKIGVDWLKLFEEKWDPDWKAHNMQPAYSEENKTPDPMDTPAEIPEVLKEILAPEPDNEDLVGAIKAVSVKGPFKPKGRASEGPIF